jgi:hypothetical protein
MGNSINPRPTRMVTPVMRVKKWNDPPRWVIQQLSEFEDGTTEWVDVPVVTMDDGVPDYGWTLNLEE